MFARVAALALLFISCRVTLAQEALSEDAAPKPDAIGEAITSAGSKPATAWIDLRQAAEKTATPQNVPAWVESIALIPGEAKAGAAHTSVLRIRVSRPGPSFNVLYFRLFFEDKPEQHPTLTVWDESGSQVLRSGPLGAGIDLESSDTVMIPMIDTSTIDVEVPGDGATVRGAYLDWMTSSEVVHPVSAEHRDLITDPFSAAAPLHAPTQDSERFGTVTATLAAESVRIGASVETGAAFQFGLEAQPLVALLTFEVASPRIAAPPEVYINGESVGPVTITLPDLADPAYRGKAEALVRPMQFEYTGWLRAQKLVPVAQLKNGTNDIIITGGAGTRASAIRSTQIQLKYLWNKSDYLLQP